MKKLFMPSDEFFDAPVVEYPWYSRLDRAICCAIAWGGSKLYNRWTCDGPDPFAGRKRGEAPGRVIIANHSSMLDPVVITTHANRHGVVIRPLYRSTFDDNPLIKRLFARLGGIPIRRGEADVKAVKRAVRAIERGEDVLVFPEGTRVWDPHATPEIFGGFSLIAQLGKCPVIPIAIDGAELINYDKRHLLPRPAKVRLRFGEPISLDDMPGANRREKCDALEREGMARVYALRAELRAEAGKD